MSLVAPSETPLAGALTRLVAVEEVCPAGDRYENPIDGLMLFGTTQGRAQWEIGARRGWHESGSLVVIAAPQTLREQVAPDDDWTVSYFLLQGAWADAINHRLHQTAGGAWNEPVSPRQRELFAAMFAGFWAQTPGWEWPFLSQCAELFDGLYQRNARPTLAQRLQAVISESPTARLTPAELARFVGLTPRQLLYRIRQETGEPLATWTRRRRIEQACQMLQSGHAVSGVAERLGYANPYHFSRQFRAVTGLAPSAYRASAETGLHPLRRK